MVGDIPRGGPTRDEVESPLYRTALNHGRLQGAAWAVVAILALVAAFAFGRWLS